MNDSDRPRTMERGTVPLRHSSSVPFMVRLPRRYEVYQQQPLRRRSSLQADPRGRDGDHVEQRRSSLQLNPVSDDDNVRVHDLNMAIQWLTQELIFIRQHDVLLRRLFHQIRRTLTNLTRSKDLSSSSDKTSTDCSGESPDFDDDDSPIRTCLLRSASSNTLYDSDDSDDSDEFRNRSCSSVTPREMAAAARRRGSKDLYV